MSGTRSGTSGGALGSGDSAPFTVDPGAIASYTVSLASPEPAGTVFGVTATARDQFANVVTTDSATVVTLSASPGTVQFDSNADGIFGDATRALSAGTVTMNARGTVAQPATVTATDTTGKTGSAPVTILSGAATRLGFSSGRTSISIGGPCSSVGPGAGGGSGRPRPGRPGPCPCSIPWPKTRRSGVRVRRRSLGWWWTPCGG